MFIVADEREAQVLTGGTGQPMYGLATVGDLRRHGHEVVATDVEEDGVLTPFSDRHADVIVAAYPDDLPAYDERLRPAERKRIRALLLERNDAALRDFDPRHEVGKKYHDIHEWLAAPTGRG